MNATELRNLDAWIDKELFDGGKFVGLKKRGLWWRSNARGYTAIAAEAGRYTREEAKRLEYPHDDAVTICELPIRHYTTDPSAAMMVLEKCGMKLNGPVKVYCVRADENRSGKASFWINDPDTESPTLPLAICKFSKKLFK